LRRQLDEYFAKDMKHWKKDVRDRTVNALCRIVASSQTALTPQTIRDGFAQTGQYDSNGFNLDRKMSNCTYNLSNLEVHTMREAFPKLVEIVKKQGFVTEQQLDDHHIPSIIEKRPRRKAKDERVPSQQRAMLINIQKNLQRFSNPPANLAPMKRDALKQLKKTEKKASSKAGLRKAAKPALATQPPNSTSAKKAKTSQKRKQPTGSSTKENALTEPSSKRTKTRQIRAPLRD
jgi:hypothetical protein